MGSAARCLPRIFVRIQSTRANFAKQNKAGCFSERLWLTMAAAAVLLLTTQVARAQATWASAQVPDCPVGTLAAYERLGPQGCKIGDVQFLGFSRTKGVDSIPSESVSVTPGTSIDSTDPALLLEGPWTAKPQQRLVLSYNVVVHPPAQPVETVMIQMQFGQTDGSGAAQIDGDFCPNSAPGCSQGRKLQLKMGGAVTKKDVDQQDLPAHANQLRVTETLNLSSGRNGSARVNGFMTVFELAAVKSK